MENFDKFLFSETFKLLSISVLRILCCCVRFQLVVCVSWQGGMKRGCVIKHIPYALKGQKLLAQGSALGIIAINKTPCKGKSFVYCPVF